MNRRYITVAQFAVEILSYAVLLFSLALAIYYAVNTDGQIPTHYAFDGTIDGYGSPMFLLIMPIMMLIMHLIMLWTIHFSNPHKWNMSFKVNEDKELIVYHDFIWMYVLFDLEFAIYSLLYVIQMMRNGALFALASILFTAVIIPTAIVPLVMAKRHNAK
ncbi:MAG: DUF1648 domain-containing protein [Lachnospiraceae bacterium]|nr:DUF1648 domain-containing protein [Lachnospiraceae bacterium]